MIQPSSLIADAEWPPKNMLRLHEINGPGNFYCEMIFEFDKNGQPLEVEMCDILASTKEEAAEQARVKWGWTSVILYAPICPGPSASPLQSEWQCWSEEREPTFRKRPEDDFPREKRFVVKYMLTCLLTDGTWSEPWQERGFRLADSAEDALASVQAHMDNPKYFVPGAHRPYDPVVEPCPDMPAYYTIHTAASTATTTSAKQKYESRIH